MFSSLHIVLTSPFFSFSFLSFVLQYILWPCIASGHEVFGKAASVWSSTSCSEFWTHRLRVPFPKHRGKCRILNWGSTLLCVPLLFVFLYALFWREWGRRDYLQICHWTKNINPWGSECAWSSLPRALCHHGQRWALKGDKDATLLTPELQSTR